MGALINVSIDVTKLPKEKFVTGKNGAVYYDFTISVNDTTDQYGKNVSVYDSHTQEEREAKKNRNWLGGGKVMWTDGNISKAEAKQESAPTKVVVSQGADLPF